MTTSYSLVMRAYPESYRTEYGDELVLTANELSDGWSFRESRSLLAEGLRTRTRLAANGSPREVWAKGIAFALGFSFFVGWMQQIVLLLGVGDDGFDYGASLVLAIGFAVIPISMMISTRWPTALLVIAITGGRLIFGLLIAEPPPGSSSTTVVFVAYNVLSWVFSTGLLVWLAARTEGPRAFSPRFGALLALITVGLAWLFQNALAPSGLRFVAPWALLLLGLALVTVDPRPLVAVLAFFSTWVPPVYFIVFSGIELAAILAMAIAVFAGLVCLARFSTSRALGVVTP